MFFLFYNLFDNIPPKDISLDSIRNYMNCCVTKRIHFATSHANALKLSNDRYSITLPFLDTIQYFLFSELPNGDGQLFPSKFGNNYYRIISSERELKEYQDFISKYRNIVFLKDNLDVSFALDLNFNISPCLHTRLGDLEYRAKYHNDQDAIDELIKTVQSCFDNYPCLHHIDAICAMPQKRNSNIKLPKLIVNSIQFRNPNVENISDMVWWNKQHAIKDVQNTDDKLNILQNSVFEIDSRVNLSGKTVLILDDLYKSGASINYAAMKLKEAGAARVFGMCLVKSLRNS